MTSQKQLVANALKDVSCRFSAELGSSRRGFHQPRRGLYPIGHCSHQFEKIDFPFLLHRVGKNVKTEIIGKRCRKPITGFIKRIPHAFPAALRNPKDAASFLVADFQFKQDGEVLGEPERQRRQRLAEREGIAPGLQLPGVAGPRPAAGGGVERGRLVGQGGVGLAQDVQKVAVQICGACRDKIHDRDTDSILDQRRAFRDEGVAVLGSILVGGADDLDRGHEPTAGPGVVDADLVLVKIGEIDRDGQGRPRRVPGRRQRPSSVGLLAGGRGIKLVLLVGRYINFKGRTQMDLWLGHISLRQTPVEAEHDHGGPLSEETLPRPPVGQRRVEVIAQRHDGTLGRTRSTFIPDT